MRMHCPKCNSANVYHSGYIKWEEKGNIVKRKRLCRDCKYKFLTYEVFADDYIEATELARALINLIKKHLFIDKEEIE